MISLYLFLEILVMQMKCGSVCLCKVKIIVEPLRWKELHVLTKICRTNLNSRRNENLRPNTHTYITSDYRECENRCKTQQNENGVSIVLQISRRDHVRFFISGGINVIPISGLKDLTDKEKCCIVGTLFKEMELKPSILKEISQQVKQLVAN